MCRSVAEARAAVHPDNLVAYEILDAALTKWCQHWTFVLHRWACVGIDLANHPPDRPAKYCCVVRINRRPNSPSPSPSRAFMMTSAEIMSNEEFLKVLWVEIGPTREEFNRLKKETREDNIMCLAILCEGLVNFQYFKLDQIETLRNAPPNLSRAVAENWADNLIHIVESGDASKESSDRHLSRTIEAEIAGPPASGVTGFMI